MNKISLIIPCYNEEESLELFEKEIDKVIEKMQEYTFEILYINDGSKDKTLEIIKKLSQTRNYIKYISFSRNFGKEAAMYAGFEHATGDYIAIMDADLQDPPSLLPEMVNILENENYDSVATRRVTRKGEPPIRSWFARRFYKLINKITDADIVDGARDYRLMKKKMVNAILEMNERTRFSKGIFGWIGFKTYWFEYENIERVAGETKWNFWKLFKYAIVGIISFSDIPLQMATVLGIITLISAFILIIISCFTSLSIIIPVLVFFAGVQLLCTGILGLYIGKIFTETKHRPLYISDEMSEEKQD